MRVVAIHLTAQLPTDQILRSEEIDKNWVGRIHLYICITIIWLVHTKFLSLTIANRFKFYPHFQRSQKIFTNKSSCEQVLIQLHAFIFDNLVLLKSNASVPILW